MTKETATFTLAPVYKKIKILKSLYIRHKVKPCTTMAKLFSNISRAKAEVVDVYTM